MPGTSANAGNTIWVIGPQGCSKTYNEDISNCADERGYIFKSNESTTWSTSRLSNGGLYELDTFEERYLGLTGNAYYGFDQVGLGLVGSGLPTLDNMVVAALADNNFWLGSLGLSPVPHNFTDLNSPIPSMLSTLRSNGQIASTSWAYTAGAPYKSPPVYGSLTLGGYDEARRNSSATLEAIPFGADFSRDLLVGIESITFDTFGSAPLLSQGIYAFMDSMVTAMWLPGSVCKAFEQAFGLQWDADSELYLLSDAQHSDLVAQNPTFTFTLAAEVGPGSKTVEITIPYEAFDLQIDPPYVTKTSRYFPLKRAQNETQYTLGRVFLQEALVIAEYDRQRFSVSQASFPTSDVTQNLTVLYPNGTAPSEGSGSAEQQNEGLSTGAIAGIAVGGAAVVIAAIAAFVICLRRKRAKARQDRTHELEGTSDQREKRSSRGAAEMGTDGTALFEAGGHAALYEVGSNQKPLLSELGDSHDHRYELPTPYDGAEKDGSSAGRIDPVEMEAPISR